MHWFATLWMHLAQATPPTAEELTLLKEQIEFLKEANSSLADTFAQYVSTVETSLTFIGIALGAITLLGTVVFGSSVKDFYQTLSEVKREVQRLVQLQVEQEVVAEVRSRVGNRVDRLEAILTREDVLGRMTVDYVLPAPKPGAHPQRTDFLLHVLGRRGLQTLPKYLPALKDSNAAASLPEFQGDIVVLDLHNADIEKDQADAIIHAVATKVPRQKSALVVYIIGYQSQALFDLPKQGYNCVPANSPLSLIGRVVEAAYVVDAIKH